MISGATFGEHWKMEHPKERSNLSYKGSKQAGGSIMWKTSTQPCYSDWKRVVASYLQVFKMPPNKGANLALCSISWNWIQQRKVLRRWLISSTYKRTYGEQIFRLAVKTPTSHTGPVCQCKPWEKAVVALVTCFLQSYRGPGLLSPQILALACPDHNCFKHLGSDLKDKKTSSLISPSQILKLEKLWPNQPQLFHSGIGCFMK